MVLKCCASNTGYLVCFVFTAMDLNVDTSYPLLQGSWLTSAINSVGRAMFFPQLSLFPVLYLDQDIAVFEFPPLRTKIAVARLQRT
jgi:hypothetical protein